MSTASPGNIVTIPPVTPTGTQGGSIDWQDQLPQGADYVRLANWTPNSLLVHLAGDTHNLDPWTADVYPAYCRMGLQYTQLAVSPAAGLPVGSTATIIVTVAYGVQIPGVYPLPLPVSGFVLDTTTGDIQPVGLLAQTAGGVGRGADAGHVHPLWIDVKGYAAMGNGVADDTAAIQKAIDAAAKAGGGIVYFPPGTYLLSSPLLFKTSSYSYVRLIGDSRILCTLLQGSGNTPVVQFEAEDTHNWTIEELRLAYSANQPSTSTNAQAINFQTTGGIGDGWYFGTVRRVAISGAATGIGIQGSGSLPVWGCLFDDIDMNAISLHLVDLTSPSAAGMPSNAFRRIHHQNGGVAIGAGYAIQLQAAPEAHIDVLGIEDWAYTGLINVTGGNPVAIRGLHVERWTGSAAGSAILVGDGPLLIADATFLGTPNANAGINLFNAENAGARLFIERLVSSMTISNVGGFNFLIAAAGAKCWLRSIQNSGTGFTIPSGDATTKGTIVEYDNQTPIFVGDGGSPGAPLATSVAEWNLASDSLIVMGDSSAGAANPQLTFYRTFAGARAGQAIRLLQPDALGTFKLQKGHTNNAAYGTETYDDVLIITSAGVLQALFGVGLDTVDHAHPHTHGAHHHNHAHFQQWAVNNTGAASAGTAHTHPYNDPSGTSAAGGGTLNDSTDATPASDASIESAKHTHQG